MRCLSLLKALSAILLSFSLSIAAAAEIAGIKIPEHVQVGGTELVLNGAGIRSKFFIKIYAGALYLPHRARTVSEIIKMPGPKRVAMYFLYDEVSREKLVNSWNEGFENNQSEAQLKELQPRIEQFIKLFRAVKRGDLITIDYLPDSGNAVAFNGSEQGIVPGADFTRALLEIWLGTHPADEDLKEDLLGK